MIHDNLELGKLAQCISVTSLKKLKNKILEKASNPNFLYRDKPGFFFFWPVGLKNNTINSQEGDFYLAYRPHLAFYRLMCTCTIQLALAS